MVKRQTTSAVFCANSSKKFVECKLSLRYIWWTENSSKSLKSIGIDIISNDKLRQQITYLYSVQYEYIQEYQEFDHDFSVKYIFSDISKHLDLIQWPQKAVPIDYDELRKDNKLKQHLRFNILYREYVLVQYKEAKVLIVVLIEDIENEIDKN